MPPTTSKSVENKKYALTLQDRILLSGLFPDGGDFRYLIIKRDIEKKVIISQEEVKKYKIVILENGTYQYDVKLTPNSFPTVFTNLELNEMKFFIQKLSDDKKAIMPILELAELFGFEIK